MFNVVPRILVIHLKRFDNFQRKIKKFVKYENEINLNKFLFENKTENYRYRLFSVLVHDGYSINSGHYYSYIKNSNDMWFCMNDSHVSRVNEKEIFQQSPYILFYEKIVEQKKLPMLKEIKVEKKIEENISSLDTSSSETFFKPAQKSKDSLMYGVESVGDKKENIVFKPTEKKENLVYKPIERNEEIVFKPLDKREDIIVKPLIENPIQIIHKERTNDTLSNSHVSKCVLDIAQIPIKKAFVSRKRKTLHRILKSLKKNNIQLTKIKKDKKIAPLEKKIVKVTSQDKIISNDKLKVNNDINKIADKSKPAILQKQDNNINNNQQNSFNKSNFNKIMKIHNPNLKDLYGSDKVEIWDSDTEADSDLLKKQICFIKNTSEFKSEAIPTKSDYDKEYDQGKTKKIKLKKDGFSHSFAKMVNKKLLYQK
jgi:hypothetical protein